MDRQCSRKHPHPDEDAQLSPVLQPALCLVPYDSDTGSSDDSNGSPTRQASGDLYSPSPTLDSSLADLDEPRAAAFNPNSPLLISSDPPAASLKDDDDDPGNDSNREQEDEDPTSEAFQGEPATGDDDMLDAEDLELAEHPDYVDVYLLPVSMDCVRHLAFATVEAAAVNPVTTIREVLLN